MTRVDFTPNHAASAQSVAPSPATGAALFTSPATIALAATASDTDGSVARVDFYAGSTQLGTDTTAPFQFSWTNVPAGSYSLTARAMDDSGAQTTSAAVTVTVNAPPPPPPPTGGLPAPWTSRDIGAVGPAGSASFGNNTFTMNGSGADIWYYADAFHYMSQPVTGDVDIIARVTSIENVHAWVKAGVMIREQPTPESAHAMMIVSPGKGLAFQRRTATWGASTSTAVAPARHPRG